MAEGSRLMEVMPEMEASQEVTPEMIEEKANQLLGLVKSKVSSPRTKELVRLWVADLHSAIATGHLVGARIGEFPPLDSEKYKGWKKEDFAKLAELLEQGGVSSPEDIK